MNVVRKHKRTRTAREADEPVYQEESAEILELYLNEIGQIALVTPQDEIRLAASIKKGSMTAREQLIKANLRLVVRIAKSYIGLGVPFMDLINEGNIGLMIAVDRFDPAKGAKLSTYAGWWIKQRVMRALANQGKTIRAPVHVSDTINRLRRVSRRLFMELGRDPDDEELADELNLSVDRVRQLRKIMIRPISLDQPIGDDEKNTVGDVIPDERAIATSGHFDTAISRNLIASLLEHVSQADADILERRFGLNGYRSPQTLDEVGKVYGLTRERIRQRQQKSLRKFWDLLRTERYKHLLPEIQEGA